MTTYKKRHAWLSALVLTALAGSGGWNQGLALESGTPSSPYPPGAASPVPSLVPEAQPGPTNTGATSGMIFMGGRQTFAIYPAGGRSVDERFEDIHNRIMGVIQPRMSNTAQAVTREHVSVRISNFQPVLYLKENAIATITNEDADRARTDPLILAHQWAALLKDALGRYQVGEMLPNDWITLKPGLAEPPRLGTRSGNKVMTTVGNINYAVKGGVVTLNGVVESNYERAMAEVAVRRIPAVLQVVNKIQVRPRVRLQLQKARDSELQRQVGEQLDQVIQAR